MFLSNKDNKMAYNPQNIFAKILTGEIPCEKVDEDQYMLAFKDIYPKASLHILVIPKGEYTCFNDFATKADAEHVAGFFKAVQRIARQMGVEKNGYRLIMNTGNDGGQEIEHFHVHILGGEKLGPF